MKTLNDFIDGSETTVGIIKARYGQGFIAFVADEEYVSTICSALTGGDSEACDIRYGIFETDWYPVGFGNTIEEAIISLNIRVTVFMSDEGMCELFNKAYSTIAHSLYRYDKELVRYVFNNQYTQDNFPAWLRKYTTLSEAKLHALLDPFKGKFNA